MAKKFDTQCGAEAGKIDRFCGSCGGALSTDDPAGTLGHAKVAAGPPETPTQPVAAVENATTQQPLAVDPLVATPRGRSCRWWSEPRNRVGAAVLAFAAVLAAAFGAARAGLRLMRHVSPRWFGIGLVFLLAACSSGQASHVIDTTGLTKVSIRSYQALPPPYRPTQFTITSASGLAAFQSVLVARNIKLLPTKTTSDGCTGGIQYTIVLTRAAGIVELDVYSCGHSFPETNINGNLPGFVSDLDGLSKYASSSPSP